MKSFSEKQFFILGLGKSGLGAAKLLAEQGARVSVWDDGEAKRADVGGSYSVVPPEEVDWQGLRAVIWSPGIPSTFPAPHRAATLAREHNVPLWCDIELLYRTYPEARYVGITGTNGKSTATALAFHIAKELGIDAAMGGNIGVAASELALQPAKALYVIEASSYQLELLEKTRFNAAVLLNITPDHLDRHGSMEGYVAAKRRIFDQQETDDTAIIARDDTYTQSIYERIKDYNKQKVVSYISEKEIRKLPDSLQGKHNLQNYLAVEAVFVQMGYAPDAILQAAQRYGGLAHRMQKVGTLGEVVFINDSKATNAEATKQALGTFQDIYWLVGGVAKAEGIDPLTPYFNRIRKAFLFGEAQERFAETLSTHNIPFERRDTLEKAFNHAVEEARRGVVLLSPSCASFDQFANFEQRGERFEQLVREMVAATGK